MESNFRDRSIVVLLEWEEINVFLFIKLFIAVAKTTELYQWRQKYTYQTRVLT